MFNEDELIDWDFVHKMTTNTIGDSDACIHFMQYVCFPKPIVADAPSYVSEYVKDMGKCGLSADMHHILKMIIMSNLWQISTVHTLGLYTSHILSRDTSMNVASLSASFTDYRFGADDYNRTFVWILKQCDVTLAFERELEVIAVIPDAIVSVVI